jgi:ABC-2 type transport system ATP-binding protein
MIVIDQVKKTYSSGTEALKGVSFTIEKGEILSLLGVNGSGKTTLSSVLATLHPPTSGDILWNGISIFGSNINAFRKILGYCPQKPNLHPLLTVEQNLYYDGLYFGLSDKESKRKMAELFENLSIGKYADFKPSELSGGYQQRVMIARALMHNPEFIIFDEPTVGLDPSARKHLWGIIKDLGKTVLLTTHYLEESEALSDRICILDKGKVMLIDRTENIKAANDNSNLEEIFIKLTQEETV